MSPPASKIEFDVDLNCDSCKASIEKALSKLSVIESIQIDVGKQSVVVDSSLPSQVIQEAIESTGKRAVLKGIGVKNFEAAVAELRGAGGVFGVIRFHQTDNNSSCVIDGTVDGLPPGEHGLHIHEYGDLLEECANIGPHFNPNNSNHGGQEDTQRHYGDLGNIAVESNGRSSFRLEDPVVKVQDIIGRSISISSEKDDLGRGGNEQSKLDGNSGESLACAIIARSAGLFSNPKRLCPCDGVSVWDERKQPSSSL